ncbi:MAG: aminoglycoside phosphotransferase family protein [Actinomycetota bacterium]
MPRRVRLVLCSPDGEPLGTLPEFGVETPWWPDVEPVVEIVRERFGIDIIVLRLLTADSSPPEMGGAVAYLAELVGDPPPGGILGSVIAGSAGEDHALRADWARPGGVAATVTWADAALARIGRPRTERVVQVRSWNLSSILRLPTASGDVWCKSVPPFFSHEGAILALVGAEDPSIVPTVLAADPKSRTVLLDDVAGEDQYDASGSRLVEMVQRLVRLQSRLSGRVDDLRTAGLPDRRARPLRDLIGTLAGRSDVRVQLTVEERVALDTLVADLPRRLALLADCGLPETLVHGDFHPGNWRLGEDAFVLLDWGDSGIGHPMLDLTAFLPRVPDEVRERILATWLDAWNAELPSADPLRASELVAPIAALRQALIYQGFLDGIEPDERRYHDTDVAYWLRRAIEGSSG